MLDAAQRSPVDSLSLAGGDAGQGCRWKRRPAFSPASAATAALSYAEASRVSTTVRLWTAGSVEASPLIPLVVSERGGHGHRQIRT